MAADVEQTVIARFQKGREPDEQEWKEVIENVWLGVLVATDEEEV